MYYVYTHIFSNGVRYVGKGKGYRHVHTKNRNVFWQNLYNKYGMPLVELTLLNLTEKEALFYEKQCISNYKKAKVKLCNITEGGEGESHSHTNEHRQKLRINNPNKKVINVYDHNNVLQKQYNGTLTSTVDDIPKNAFIKSYKNNGLPLGYTKQSRIELRKRMHQRFIGWYALVAGTKQQTYRPIDNLYAEQTTGLYSTIHVEQTGINNPNAKAIYILNEKNTIVAITYGNFSDYLVQQNWPKSLFEKSKKTKSPIATNRIKYRFLNGWRILLKEDYDNYKKSIK